MARPLREGSLGEPPAPLPAPPPACGGVGGGGGGLLGAPLPAWGVGGGLASAWRGGDFPAASHRHHPRLSCTCLPPPTNFIFYRCGTRGPPPAAVDTPHGLPMENGAHAGPPPNFGVIERVEPRAEPPPSPEQELGARLRRLGDAFQQLYEEQRRGGTVWGHLSRLVWQLLGVVYN